MTSKMQKKNAQLLSRTPDYDSRRQSYGRLVVE
jgi:hypothetical protein